MLLGEPRLASLSGSGGVVLAKDEVLEFGGTAVRPVDDVVAVNPQM
jgi:hypothetical protein